MLLDAGLGYGGSCFPKDVKALAYMAAEKGRHPQLLHAVMEINDDRRPMAVDRLREMLGDLKGKTIGLLGLSFKPNTDDMRDAPSIDIAQWLAARRAHRCALMTRWRWILPRALLPEVMMCRRSLHSGGRLRCADGRDRMERVQAARPGAALETDAPASYLRWAQYLRSGKDE